jgi:hypothetical protein
VKAKTLKIYEIEAPTPPATYSFLLRDIVIYLIGIILGNVYE